MKREPINFKINVTKCNDNHEDSLSFPIRSTVAVQHEDEGPWMHRVFEEANNTDHNGWSYIITVIKTGRHIVHSTGLICRTPITREQYP